MWRDAARVGGAGTPAQAGLGLPRRRGWDRRGGMGAEGVFTRVPSARGVRASSACMPPARMILLVIGERAVE